MNRFADVRIGVPIPGVDLSSPLSLEPSSFRSILYQGETLDVLLYLFQPLGSPHNSAFASHGFSTDPTVASFVDPSLWKKRARLLSMDLKLLYSKSAAHSAQTNMASANNNNTNANANANVTANANGIELVVSPLERIQLTNAQLSSGPMALSGATPSIVPGTSASQILGPSVQRIPLRNCASSIVFESNLAVVYLLRASLLIPVSLSNKPMYLVAGVHPSTLPSAKNLEFGKGSVEKSLKPRNFSMPSSLSSSALILDGTSSMMVSGEHPVVPPTPSAPVVQDMTHSSSNSGGSGSGSTSDSRSSSSSGNSRYFESVTVLDDATRSLLTSVSYAILPDLDSVSSVGSPLVAESDCFGPVYVLNPLNVHWFQKQVGKQTMISISVTHSTFRVRSHRSSAAQSTPDADGGGGSALDSGSPASDASFLSEVGDDVDAAAAANKSIVDDVETRSLFMIEISDVKLFDPSVSAIDAKGLHAAAFVPIHPRFSSILLKPNEQFTFAFWTSLSVDDALLQISWKSHNPPSDPAPASTDFLVHEQLLRWKPKDPCPMEIVLSPLAPVAKVGDEFTVSGVFANRGGFDADVVIHVGPPAVANLPASSTLSSALSCHAQIDSVRFLPKQIATCRERTISLGKVVNHGIASFCLSYSFHLPGLVLPPSFIVEDRYSGAKFTVLPRSDLDCLVYVE
eukprot:ANDGO_06265.mRNA.1 hypothetical protein